MHARTFKAKIAMVITLVRARTRAQARERSMRAEIAKPSAVNTRRTLVSIVHSPRIDLRRIYRSSAVATATTYPTAAALTVTKITDLC